MLAVLNDALLTLARHCSAADYRVQKRVYEVDVWVASEDVEWPFSFVNVCDALHLDASRVRSRLEDARRRMLRVPARGGMDPLSPTFRPFHRPPNADRLRHNRKSANVVATMKFAPFIDDQERKRQLDGLAYIAEARAFRRGPEAPCRQHKPRTRGSFVGRSFVQTIICQGEIDGHYHDDR